MDIAELQKQISPILRTYGVKRAAVFGSVSRGDDKPGSDVDLLVKLGKPMGMFMYMDLIEKMEQKLGKKVDLVTEDNLDKFLEPFISRDLKTIYEDR
jgi:predicted nucleotidyltransferase